MYFIITAYIASIHIRINTGINHCMIQSCIENSFLICCSPSYLHTTKFFIPQIIGFLLYLVKILRRNFLFEIISSTFHIDKGDANFHYNFFSFLRRKFRIKSQMLAFQLFHPLYNRSFRNTCQIRYTHDFIAFPHPIIRNICTPKAIINQRFIELCIVVDGISGISVAISPATAFRRTLHPALNSIVIYHLDILGRRCSPYSTCQIYLNTGLLIGGINKTQYAASRCCTRFYFDFIIT